MVSNEKPPAIIYVPGLSQGATNTADRVAEVLAHAIDNQVQGTSYSTNSDAAITAPRGLKVSKTIVSSSGTDVYQFFELDYKPRFERRRALPGVQATAIGALEAFKYMALGAIKLFSATVRMRHAKSFAAKCQLAIGYGLVLPLILAWLIAAYGLYVALGGPLLPWLDFISSDSALGWSISLGAFGVLTWQMLRQKILGLATATQELLDYAENRDRGRDTTCMTLDDAVAGLLDNDYNEIHVVGYSLGSLIVFDAVFAQQNSLKSSDPMSQITSMTTIGCPLDTLRMFFPKYMEDRSARINAVSVEWVNIFNAADVFGSNLRNKTDFEQDSNYRPSDRRARSAVVERASADSVTAALGAASTRYLNESLTPVQVLKAKGFRVHSGYWGEADEAHCFEPFVKLLRGPSVSAEPRVPMVVETKGDEAA